MNRAVRLDARCFSAAFMSFGKTRERSPQSLHRMCSLLHRIRMRGVRAIRSRSVARIRPCGRPRRTPPVPFRRRRRYKDDGRERDAPPRQPSCALAYVGETSSGPDTRPACGR
mgnify:CR=1 FL=1